jgi:thiazole synthase
MFQLANVELPNRLLLGSGKFSSPQLMLDAVRASGTGLVTVALKRLKPGQPSLDLISPLVQAGVKILPNTSGAVDAKEAIFAAELARELLQTNWVKLEIHPDARYLMPDPEQTLIAARELVKLGFVVLPYCSADPMLCLRLQEAGCSAVMPLGSAIGSNQGLQNQAMLKIIIEQARVPVIVDAGIGLPSHACAALEMGAAAVLVNTAIATANDPVLAANSFRLAVEAGGAARNAQCAPSSHHANASSPIDSLMAFLS